jgi:hypothetical protein
MAKKISIRAFETNEELFSIEGENPTLAEAVRQACRERVSLKGAMLDHADLRDLHLFGIDLQDAYLYNANFQNCNLRKANLRGAYLCRAYLRDVQLNEADLTNANLQGACLRSAWITDANLKGTKLRNIDLTGATLLRSINIPYYPLACPSDGEFIAWKKVTVGKIVTLEDYLVKLKIPADARRSSGTSRKCRCDKAEVLEITNIKTGQKVDSVTNYVYGFKTIHKVGEMVIPSGFNPDRWKQCAQGIHFFINKQDAIEYNK